MFKAYKYDLLTAILGLAALLLVSCGSGPTSSHDDGSDSRPGSLTVTWKVTDQSASPLCDGNGALIWQTASSYVYAAKSAAALEPPSQLKVSDIPNDNGHYLRLTWTLSPSETGGNVDWYRIYRSRAGTPTAPVPLTRFSSIDSLNSWDGHYTVLIDSVTAGTGEYADCVPLVGARYYYWVQAVGAVPPSVSGTVRDQSGNPLGGVLLRLYNANESVDLYTVSLSDGSYAFNDVPPGTYYLVAKRDNYTMFSTTVTVS
ncbi:carboxypeptidase-like regulatory domain-containing protein [bacterium]|nr:carboxypeptidase-like regulatory domain-containing protein [bacterium]